jgi:hypothetical protein
MKAFLDKITMEEAWPLCKEDAKRKALIVIEHLIQASDTALRMQH